jgi:hypothetical protein
MEISKVRREKLGKALQKLQKLRIMLENVTIMQIFPKDGIFCYNKKVKYKEALGELW